MQDILARSRDLNDGFLFFLIAALVNNPGKMATNGSLSSFLPVKNHTTPFWRTQPHEVDRLQTTAELPRESDIVIIGAGYAGTTLAYHLLKGSGIKPGRQRPYITILEAREICSGATGRNGGHLRPDIYGTIPTHVERHGVEAAAELASFEQSHIKAFKDLLAEEGDLDCDFNITRNVGVFIDEGQCRRMKETLDELDRQGVTCADDVLFTMGKNAEGVRMA